MAEMNENTPRYRLDIDTGIDIRAALEQLPGKHRTAVILTRIHGLSVRESARVLGISENNVKQRVFRGIADLRSMLGNGTSTRGAK
jgi:RNA polymerase sigma-70 factor (ECF subfamily)